MIEIRRILIPCDFSDSSRGALEHGMALARWYDAEVVVLHAVPLWPSLSELPPYVNPVVLEPEMREQLTADLGRFVEPFTSRQVAVRMEIDTGDPTDVILAHAADGRADLVVMGTHGRRGFERWAIGSVTEKVLRRAACPVLTIRLGAEPRISAERPPFQRILCAIDFSEASLQALQYALALAQEAEARITLLHVLEWQPAEEPALRAGFNADVYRKHTAHAALERLHGAVPGEARQWCEVEGTVVAGKAHEEIVRAARAAAAQLVVLGVHGASALEVLLFGSTTRHVIREAPCPVLTVRSAELLRRVPVKAGALEALGALGKTPSLAFP
jgi:nucleotide-binding universal stress UspA family protein